MQSRLHPAWLCAALYAVFLALTLAVPLPDRVATHFNTAGHADGWATREQWRGLSLVMGTALPLVAVVLFWMVRLFPVWAFNLPRREYWLGAEQRAATFRWFLGHGWHLACLELSFFIGLEWMIRRANSVSPPRLESGLLLAFTGFFLVGLATWGVQMVRHFRSPG